MRLQRVQLQIRESLRGKWIGATGPRASERQACLWEGLWEGGFQSFFLEVLRGFKRFSRGFQRFSEIFQRVFRDFLRGFQRSSQRPSQRQISVSEALSPVAPSPWAFSNQIPNSVSFLALTESWGERSASASQSTCVCRGELTKFFAELTEFAEFSLLKLFSQNNIQRAVKGGRPLTFFFGHFLVTFSRFRSLFGNLLFGYLFAYPLLPTPFCLHPFAAQWIFCPLL